jgi:hypothetical protein
MAKKKSDVDWDDIVGFLKAIVGFGLVVGVAMIIAYGISTVTEPSDPGFVVGEDSSKK